MAESINKEIKAGEFNPFLTTNEDGEKVFSIKNALDKKPVKKETQQVVKEDLPELPKEEKPLGLVLDEKKEVVPTTEDPPKEVESKVEPPTPSEKEEVGFKDTYYRVGLQMKKDGFIPEDFELKEDISPNIVYETFLQKGRQEIDAHRASYIEEIKNEVYSSLAEQGINENDIAFAMARKNGVSFAELDQQSMYEIYSNLDIEKASEEEKIRVVREGLKLSTLPPETEKLILDNLELSGEDEIDKQAKIYKNFFTEKNKEFRSYQEQVAEHRAKKQTEVAERQKRIINDVFTKSEIKSEPLSSTQLDDLKSSLFTADQVVEVEGQQYSATEFEKFQYDFKNDMETQLYLFKIIKWRGEELEQIKQKAKDDFADDWMGETKSEVIKDNTNKFNNKKSKSTALLGKFNVTEQLA